MYISLETDFLTVVPAKVVYSLVNHQNLQFVMFI